MSTAPTVQGSMAVADPFNPAHVVKPNADGSINVVDTGTSETKAEATAAAPTYGEGDNASLSQTLTGGLRVTQLPANTIAQAITPVVSTASESGRVLKGAAGAFYGVDGYVSSACYIMVFNSATVPADGAVTPLEWAYVPLAGSFSIDHGALPSWYSTGISVCASSTGPFTKTAVVVGAFSGRVK